MRMLMLLLIFWAGSLAAQTYPQYTSTTVNDFADLLPAQSEDTLSRQLSDLKRDTGIEMTVVTLPTQSPYAPDITMEQFATGLFNHWGIGEATRNDGILVLVLPDDRAMRIELGRAYAHDWDRVAERIVDSEFLPAFKNGDYVRGIMDGSEAVIDDIAMRFIDGQDAPSEPNAELWFIGAALALFTLFGARGPLSNVLARFRNCPKCGQRTLRQTRRTIRGATRANSGSGIRRVYCTNCDYADESHYTIPMRSGSSSSGFGGGSSGGGGASGRW